MDLKKNSAFIIIIMQNSIYLQASHGNNVDFSFT